MPGILQKIEDSEFLDAVAQPAADLGSKLIPQGPVKDALTGKWLGHPVHPMLTDVAISFWTAATTLDLFGKRHERSAQTLTGLGIVSAVPTAAAGIADWVDSIGEERRVGLVHAAGNVAALLAFTGSYLARRNGNSGRGKVLSLLGATFMGGSGYLGGHLAYSIGAGVDRMAFDELPDDWTPVVSEDQLLPGSPALGRAGDVDVLVSRNGSGICAIANKCTHRGGPLNEGDVDTENQTVTCPWHGSQFNMCTGEVVQGPASARQPMFETRVSDGMVEVRTVRES
ncbi:MAG TPA: Rieske 2Fe-2S domain-containing protein [Actinomycetota bacterium]|nr:Rieske 2Fe-2S domain-containing protein [Actinomycetota bacterium]